MFVKEMLRLSATYPAFQITASGSDTLGWKFCLVLMKHLAAQNIVTTYEVNIQNNPYHYCLSTTRLDLRTFPRFRGLSVFCEKNGILKFQVQLQPSTNTNTNIGDNPKK